MISDFGVIIKIIKYLNNRLCKPLYPSSKNSIEDLCNGICRYDNSAVALQGHLYHPKKENYEVIFSTESAKS
jgi:hypothetical protein